jgi:hypothetical protein
MFIPAYNSINLTDYKPLFGYYIFRIIKQHFPNVHIIELGQWVKHGLAPFPPVSNQEREYDHSWLITDINKKLKQGKVVLIMLDADHLWTNRPKKFIESLSIALNCFIDENVYLVKEHDAGEGFLSDYNIKCKTLELPWEMLNDVICYDRVSKTYNFSYAHSINKNYICFANNFRYQKHKKDLAEALYDNALSDYGLITFKKDYLDTFPAKFKEFCKEQRRPPFDDNMKEKDDSEWRKYYKHYMKGDLDSGIGGKHSIEGVLMSGNAKNFLQLNEEYNDVPLVVHCESETIFFPNTDKSVWPLLLNKLFLVFGRPGNMEWIQKFYDLDISSYADLTFDSYKKSKMYEIQLMKDNIIPYHEYTREINKKRINDLVTKNKDLIKDASYVHKELQPEIEKAGKSFGRNMYNFSMSQIESVYK